MAAAAHCCADAGAGLGYTEFSQRASLADLTAAGFGDVIAARIRAEHISISARWLSRLRELLSVEANEVFPSDQLLDHIPVIVQEVAEYLRAPEAEAVVANTVITAKAQELGELRHAQKASVHQLLAEYRVLGDILAGFVEEELEQIGISPAAGDAIEVLRRLNDAVWILMQTTVNTFISEYTTTIASHAGRLESFNRMVSHELRQPLGTLMYAIPLLRADTTRADPARQDHFLDVVERNVARLAQLMEQLEAVSRLQSVQPDTPDIQQTEVGNVARDVARQLREMAEARGVEIQIDDQLPTLVVDRARLELVLTNLVSNAIKYSDPEKNVRFVRVEPALSADDSVPCIAVRDNGLGIPAESLGTIFRRFVRAHAVRDTELGVRGSGLGLAIAAECAEDVGGALRVESTVKQGTTFFFSLPPEGAHTGTEAPRP
jgi:signal transduction histidine kinase